MNFAFSDEQEEFRSSLRRFLEEKSPATEVLRLIDTADGYDRSIWKQMAAELGLQGIQIPEAYGGQGFGFLELAITMEEMGRVLLCGPFFSSVCLAAGALLHAGSEAQKTALLPGIASGATLATLALLDDVAGWRPGDVELEFSRDDDAYVLTGRKRFVTDAAAADLILVVARVPGTRGEDGLTLLAVRGGAPGVKTSPVESLDPTRRLADVEFAGARAECVGAEGGIAPALVRTLDQACVALAAECAGGTQRCLDDAVEYAKHRVQFARPIGSFQAIKHKCADVLLEVESAKTAAHYAAWAAAENPEELPLAASVAKAFCAEAYQRAAVENVQIHGGIGFTWEATPHLYYRRARANQTLLGDATHHHRRIADLKGF